MTEGQFLEYTGNVETRNLGGLNPGADRPDGGHLPPSDTRLVASGPLVGVGIESADLVVLSVTPQWDEWVPRGPVTVRYVVAGLIGEAVVECDESSRDELPNCWGLPVTGAPEELHEDLRDIAESAFVAVHEVGRSGLEAINRARAIAFDLRNRRAA